MRTRVKICCIADPDEARQAVAAGADAIGLVSAMPSGPGCLPDDAIAAIAATAPPPVAALLLTCRTQPDDVVAHVRTCGAGVVQLVGAVPAATYEALRRDCPAVKIVQVIHVEGGEAVGAPRRVAAHVDAILLDSGRPGADVPELGGTGRVHDWTVSAAIVAAVEVPVFLAGGLKPGNVAEAVRQVRPYGVDVCSGVRAAGRLDAALLAAFMRQVAAADTSG